MILEWNGGCNKRYIFYRYSTATPAENLVIQNVVPWRLTILDHREAAGNLAAAKVHVHLKVLRFATIITARPFLSIVRSAKSLFVGFAFEIDTPLIHMMFCR